MRQTGRTGPTRNPYILLFPNNLCLGLRCSPRPISSTTPTTALTEWGENEESTKDIFPMNIATYEAVETRGISMTRVNHKGWESYLYNLLRLKDHIYSRNHTHTHDSLALSASITLTLNSAAVRLVG